MRDEGAPHADPQQGGKPFVGAAVPRAQHAMKLSVVIVNYNVKAYLEQCLRTVQEALKGLEGEVFVVDNQSTDGSVDMVRHEFPAVKLLANKENIGFSRANNQAIRACSGEYILLLNPDTVVGEDVFRKAVAFMDANPRSGGLGVKMIDGTGRFLPESKRGLPTPTVAFYKIIGLSRLFPRSRHFGRYHLGHLPENEAASIEILSGACMFLRRKVLDQVGLLDESFFMYGEDIDLSYRILLGGHENWYFPQARIIHYKGESTKKSSVNYVFVFYNAMVIFARKHFTRRGPQLFSAIIRGAIYLSAAGAIAMRFLNRALLPLLDMALLMAGLTVLHGLGQGAMPPLWERAAWAAGGAVILAAMGAYDLPRRAAGVWKGLAVIALASLAAGRWPQGVFWWPMALLAAMGGLMAGARILFRAGREGGNATSPAESARILAIGSPDEAKRALALLWQTHYGLGKEVTLDIRALGKGDDAHQIRQLARRERIHEVVFCAPDLPMGRVIALMEQLKADGVVFKIAQPASKFIIGPGTTESLNDLLILRDHAANSSSALRHRRMLDLSLALFFLATLPVGLWFVDHRAGFVRNCTNVLLGKRSWVGYASPVADKRIPWVMPGILNPVMADHLRPSPLTLIRADLEYAKDYRALQDLRRVIGNYRFLGRPA